MLRIRITVYVWVFHHLCQHYYLDWHYNEMNVFVENALHEILN